MADIFDSMHGDGSAAVQNEPRHSNFSHGAGDMAKSIKNISSRFKAGPTPAAPAAAGESAAAAGESAAGGIAGGAAEAAPALAEGLISAVPEIATAAAAA